MYEGDPYGEEIEGGDQDKNDGLNALVSYFSSHQNRISNGLLASIKTLIKVSIILPLKIDM
jgi:hypothetical protein